MKNITYKFILVFAVSILSILGQYSFAATNADIREQAKILYIGKQTEYAQQRLLEIPQNERTANDYYMLGLTFEDKNLAIQSYQQAISLDETFYQAYYNIGTIYLGAENPESAIEYFKKSVKYKKDFAYGHYNLGCAYLKADKYSKARAAFEAAIRLKPDEPDFYYNLAYIHKKLDNQKRADKAVTLYNELIKKRSEN